jgi:8-oxo-dGTP diphosphatase
MRNSIIVKCAAAIVRDKSLLLARKRGTATFISPGGKPLPGEDYLSCLIREVREELDVEVRAQTYLGTFKGISAFESVPVEMHVYLTEIHGDPRASTEIEEIVWYRCDRVSSELKVGSIFYENVIPFLLREGLIA